MEISENFVGNRIFDQTRFDIDIDNFFKFAANTELTPVHESSKLYFSRACWYISLIKRINNSFDVTLTLHDSKEDYNIYFKLGLKKTNGEVVYLNYEQCFFSKELSITNMDGLHSVIIGNIAVKEIFYRRYELAPFNTLTIVCVFKRLIINNPVAPMHQVPPMDIWDPYGLSQSFSELYYSNRNYDVTLNVTDQNGPTRKFKAHKSVLVARSPVFAAMFAHDMKEANTGVINITDCDPDTFGLLLQFTYGIKISNLSVDNVLKLYKIAQKYDVFKLTSFCIKDIVDRLNIENFFSIAALTEMYEEEQLFRPIRKFFFQNHDNILMSEEWKNFTQVHFSFATKLFLELSTNSNVCPSS